MDYTLPDMSTKADQSDRSLQNSEKESSLQNPATPEVSLIIDPEKTFNRNGDDKSPQAKQERDEQHRHGESKAVEGNAQLEEGSKNIGEFPIDLESEAKPPGDSSGRSPCLKLFKRLEKEYDVLTAWIKTNKSCIRRIGLVVLILHWVIYLIFAVIVGGHKATAVIVITAVVVVIILWKIAKKRFRKRIVASLNSYCCSICTEPVQKWTRRIFFVLVCVALVVFVALDTSRKTENLISLGGLLLLLGLVFITSTNPFQVKWRPVLWGLAIQFVLALVILRWDTGFQVFQFMGEQVKTFMEYSDAGAKFVFDHQNYIMHRFAFKVLPVVIFFSSIISILYHWGVIQSVVETLAWALRYTMGTTAVESLGAAAHIFIGQLESSVMLKPFLHKLTVSELTAVMTTGFATIAGTVVSAYIEFGAPPEHLLAASFMSGPAALALSKLSLPETEVSLTKTIRDVKLPKGEERNVIQAASVGAVNSIKLVAYIVVNIIAFLSILEFVNVVLAYLGANVGIDGLSFQLICSYVFMPLAAVMGIPWEDAGKVGTLIGTKIFINEFVGYAQLGQMKRSGEIQERTAVISTYILCGFGSIQSLGITLGVFSAVAPSRKQDVARYMLRALILGNIACFCTACIAGMLYNGMSVVVEPSSTNMTSPFNRTVAP